MSTVVVHCVSQNDMRAGGPVIEKRQLNNQGQQ